MHFVMDTLKKILGNFWYEKKGKKMIQFICVHKHR